MDYGTAFERVKALAAEGDIKGIQAVVQQAQKSGMDPMLVMCLGQFTEAAILNMKPPKSRR